MADFAAVLKKTLEKMGETTPETRERVYQKARETVSKQIDAMAARPPQAAIDRQFAKLEEAIGEVESAYIVPDVDIDEPELDVDEIVAEATAGDVTPEPVAEDPVAETVESPVDEPEPVVEPEAEPEPEEPVVAEPVVDDGVYSDETVADVDEVIASVEADDIEVDDDATVEPDSDPLVDFLNEHSSASDDAEADIDQAIDALRGHSEPSEDVAVDGRFANDGTLVAEPRDAADDALSGVPVVDTAEADHAPGVPVPDERPDYADAEASSSPSIKKLALAAVVAAALGGGAYAAYQNQDSIKGWWADLTAGQEATDANGVPVRTVTTTPVEETPTETAQTEETPPAEQAPVDAGNTGDAPEKFTQRLTEDGTEVDTGPATDPAGTAEGSSVAGQSNAGQDAPATGDQPTATPDAAPDAAPDATTDTGTDQTPAASDSAVPVGQRAIFYEERTGAQSGTAIAGAAIWSVTQMSPGADLPPEPAIKAEASIPELGLTMEMTIRRNGDPTFPASHVIELFFRVPDTFEGRGIADVQRVTFKNTEQDPGSALIAVPAPLDTNIFMIALTSAATAIETNVQLMKREGWIDIPMQYVSGRRALVTFEKGIPGERVFNEVFAAWDANPLPQAQ